MFFNKKDKPFIIPARFYNDPRYISLYNHNREAWLKEIQKIKNG